MIHQAEKSLDTERKKSLDTERKSRLKRAWQFKRIGFRNKKILMSLKSLRVPVFNNFVYILKIP